MKRIAVLAALLLGVLAAPALGQHGPYPAYHNSVKETAASTVIEYFHVSQAGVTTTASSRQEFQHLSVYNAHTSEVSLLIYTGVEPAWDGAFSEAIGDDYITFAIPAQTGQTFIDINGIGYFVATNPTSAGLYLHAWNGRP